MEVGSTGKGHPPISFTKSCFLIGVGEAHSSLQVLALIQPTVVKIPLISAVQLSSSGMSPNSELGNQKKIQTGTMLRQD